MGLWRKNKKLEKELPSFLTDGLSKLNQRLIRAAGYLQTKTNAYSLKRKKILLLFFVIAFAAKSSIIIVQSISSKTRSPIGITRIRGVPPQQLDQRLPVSKKEFLRIQKFKSYIDSLNTSKTGVKLKDSLLQNRPHLMDSINFLINLYLQQSKVGQ